MLKKTIIGLFLVASLAVAGTITVQPGDTLGTIAVRYNVSVTELMRLNNLTTQNIRAGQELRLPSSASVTVQPGDTLEGIAKRNGISVIDLRRANNLTSDAIRPGQTLRLPSSRSSAKTSSSSSSQPRSNGTSTYTVQSGDTLEGIGKRFGVTVDVLKTINGLQNDRLQLGQVLKLPSNQPRASASSSAVSKPRVSSQTPTATNLTKPDAEGWITVQPGDTLSAISKRHSVSLEKLRTWNKLNSDAIRDGQRLRVKPAPSASKPVVQKKTPAKTTAQKPSAKPTSKPVVSSQKPGTAKPVAASTAKPTTSTATKPVAISAAKPASKPAPSSNPPKPVATSKPVVSLEPMDPSAAGPSPTAPSDVLDGDVDFEIIAPTNPPATINRNERVLWPLSGVLTSRYGYRWGRLHTGLDIATPTGTAVYAALSGTVQFSGWNRYGYGYLVVVRGVDGRDYYYAHNSRLLVKRGQFVRQGYLISRSGNTGNSTGPHLHFEIRIGGKPRNPMSYLPKSQVQQARYAGR
jgi:murein DD-endopeptidase MepM/ murein hydrolase activator NlpD